MPITVQVKGLSDLVAGLGNFKSKLDEAAAYATAQAGLAFEAQAKRNFQGVHRRVDGHWEPGAHIHGSPDFPNVRTGNLRRSIMTELRQGFGTYSVSVGPTMVYSRAVELGRNGAGYPYMRPAYDKVKPQVTDIFVRAVKRRLAE